MLDLYPKKKKKNPIQLNFDIEEKQKRRRYTLPQLPDKRKDWILTNINSLRRIKILDTIGRKHFQLHSKLSVRTEYGKLCQLMRKLPRKGNIYQYKARLAKLKEAELTKLPLILPPAPPKKTSTEIGQTVDSGVVQVNEKREDNKSKITHKSDIKVFTAPKLRKRCRKRVFFRGYFRKAWVFKSERSTFPKTIDKIFQKANLPKLNMVGCLYG